MKQHIEAVEGIFSLENYKEIIRVDGEANTKPYLLINYFYGAGDPLHLYFESIRGRDAAYADVMFNLGRSAVIQVGRYQDWSSK